MAKLIKEIVWNLEDEMQRGGVHSCLLEIRKNRILKKLVKSVEGDLSETDGDFVIELNNDEKITYHYKFSPHRSMEKIGDKQFYITRPDGIQIELDFDKYLDHYCDMGMIYAALQMYIEKKLSIDEVFDPH